MIKKIITNTGFTLVELMISIAIFALMTALVMSKYGSFNQGILLTNLAYDVALTLRTAQSYGLNVKSAPRADENYSVDFQFGYGVHFDKTSPGNTKIILFTDKNDNGNGTFGNGFYETGEEISTSNIKRGSYVSSICTGNDVSSCDNFPNTLDIAFRRPDPRAIIAGGMGYAEIQLHSSDGGAKKIIVNRTGQIAVSD